MLHIPGTGLPSSSRPTATMPGRPVLAGRLQMHRSLGGSCQGSGTPSVQPGRTQARSSGLSALRHPYENSLGESRYESDRTGRSGWNRSTNVNTYIRPRTIPALGAQSSFTLWIIGGGAPRTVSLTDRSIKTWSGFRPGLQGCVQLLSVDSSVAYLAVFVAAHDVW